LVVEGDAKHLPEELDTFYLGPDVAGFAWTGNLVREPKTPDGLVTGLRPSGSRDFGPRRREPIASFEHAGVGVEELQLAVGDRVANDEGALPYSPKSFSALKIRQLVAFGHRESEDLRGVRGLG